jgi:aryl-alcohol dehydrogenase-like predicted oxidoreductase
MQYRPLGTSGLEASVVAFGAWAIGGWNWGWQDDDQSIRALHAAIDAGINLIDTAPVYGFGRSEEVVGRAIARRRDDVLIATKVGMRWDTDRGKLFFRSSDEEISADGSRRVHVYSSPESVRMEVHASLKRLGVERLDLVQTHWQDETTPIADTMGELLRLKDEGKIRAIGACNASIEQLEEYRSVGPLDSDQERYSLLDRGAEAEKLPWCLRNNVAFLAYSPLANGLLTGRMGPEREFPKGDMRNVRPRFSKESRQLVSDALEGLKPIAQRHGVTLAQLVIAWTLGQSGMTHALVGARDEKQAKENAAAAHVTLSDDELKTVAERIGNLGERVGSSAATSTR